MTEYIHTPEDKARHKVINPMLKKAGWIIQDFKNANIWDKVVAKQIMFYL